LEIDRVQILGLLISTLKEWAMSTILKTVSLVAAFGFAIPPAQTAAQHKYESGMFFGHGTYHSGNARLSSGSAGKSPSGSRGTNNTLKRGTPQERAVPVPSYMQNFRKPKNY
jgi:hypothetical protein